MKITGFANWWSMFSVAFMVIVLSLRIRLVTVTVSSRAFTCNGAVLFQFLEDFIRGCIALVEGIQLEAYSFLKGCSLDNSSGIRNAWKHEDLKRLCAPHLTSLSFLSLPQICPSQLPWLHSISFWRKRGVQKNLRNF